MTLVLTIIGVSVGVLVLLLSLFKAEESRGSRIVLPRVREYLDRGIVGFSNKLAYFFGHLGSGVVRTTFHYLLHKFLNVCIALLTKSKAFLAHLQLRNKRVAKVMKAKTTENHLDAIAAHREETALSEEEKRQRRLH
jgi:hypothetical protein